MIYQRFILIHKTEAYDPHELYTVHYRTDNDFFALIKMAIKDFIAIYGVMPVDYEASIFEIMLEELSDSTIETRERARFCRVKKYTERLAECAKIGLCTFDAGTQFEREY